MYCTCHRESAAEWRVSIVITSSLFNCVLRLVLLCICFGEWRCVVVFGYEIPVYVLHTSSATFLHIPVIPIAEYLSWHAGLSIKHQGYSVIFPNTEAWSQRQPACAEASQDGCGAEDDNKRNAFYLHWDRIVLLGCFSTDGRVWVWVIWLFWRDSSKGLK